MSSGRTLECLLDIRECIPSGNAMKTVMLWYVVYWLKKIISNKISINICSMKCFDQCRYLSLKDVSFCLTFDT